MIRGGFRGRGRYYRNEGRAGRDTPPDSRLNQGSRLSLAEPDTIDLLTTHQNKFEKWDSIKRAYTSSFVEKFEYFSDIINLGTHHQFPEKPTLSVEEDLIITNITPDLMLKEQVWVLAHPLSSDAEKAAHLAAAESYAKNCTDFERNAIHDAIKVRRADQAREEYAYLKAYPKVFDYIKRRLSPALLSKLSINPLWIEQTTVTTDPLWLWNATETAVLGIEPATEGGDKIAKQIQLIESLNLKSTHDRRKQHANELVSDYYNWYLASRHGLLMANIEIDEKEAVAQFLHGLNSHYNQLLDYLRNSLEIEKVDKYPDTLPEAYVMAMKYVITSTPTTNVNYTTSSTNEHTSKVNNNKKSSNKPAIDRAKIKCTHCLGIGHTAEQCFSKDLSQAKAIEKYKKWQAKKANSKQETESSRRVIDVSNNANAKSNNSNNDYGDEVKHAFYTSTDNDHEIEGPVIILDTGANVGLYKDESLLYNIVPTSSMTVEGINNNLCVNLMGISRLTQSTVYFNPKAIANVECYYDLLTTSIFHDITQDGMEFIFELKDGNIITFVMTKEDKLAKLQNVFTSDDIDINNKIYVTTVMNNLKLFEKKDSEKAKLARQFQENLGCSVTSLKLMLSNNCITDCPFTPKDVENAETIYGPSISSAKGRTQDSVIRECSVQSSKKFIEKDIILSTDILFIAGFPFMLSVNDFGYVLVRRMKNKDMQECKKTLDNFISAHTSQGFKVIKIKTDEEKGIVALTDYYGDKEITVEVWSKGSHVSTAENKIKELKNHCRMIAHQLPYPLNTVLLNSLVISCTFTINCIPQYSKNVLQSPREMFSGQKLNYNMIDCGFGQYVTVNSHLGIKNTLQSRALECIALYPIGDSKGSRRFIDLNTGYIITRSKCVVIPIPQSVIKRMIQISEKEGLIINERLDQWKSSKEIEYYEEDFEKSTENLHSTSDQMSLVEKDRYKEVSNDIDFSIDQYTSTNDITDEDEQTYNDEFTSVPSLEQQSQSLVSEYNPSEDETGQIDIDLDIEYARQNYWTLPQFQQPLLETPILQQPTINEPSSQPTHDYNLRSRNQVLLTKRKKTKEGNLTPSEGILLGDVGIDSMNKELQNMLNLQVWKPVHSNTISNKKDVIRSRMFLRKKRNGTIKSRLVAGGHMQDKNLYTTSNTSSPTVSTDTLLMLLAIYGSNKSKIVTIDIVAAYLNCDIIKTVYMSLDKLMTSLIIKLDTSYLEYVDHNGCVTVLLLKALYGLIESAKLFYDHLSKSLIKLGFTRNCYDQCVWNRTGKTGRQLTICFHVDDLLCACIEQDDLDEFAQELKTMYVDITVNTGLKHDYLGIDIDFTEEGCCKIDMTKYIKTILKDFNIKKKAITPADVFLFTIDEQSHLLNKDDKELFHTIVAKLLYMSPKARGDVMTPIAYLTTRVLYPTIFDWNKLVRLVRYLLYTQDLIMRLECNNSMQLEVYVDASYAKHPDCKSHSGCTMTIGKGTVHCKSKKQSLVTRSSTEAELVAISDSVCVGIWARNFLQIQNGEQHFLFNGEIPPVILYQDNLSTVKLAEHGRSTSPRTRHIDIRYFFIKDRIISGEVVIKPMGSEMMIADIMTKPLQGKLFRRLRKMLLNNEDVEGVAQDEEDTDEQLLQED